MKWKYLKEDLKRGGTRRDQNHQDSEMIVYGCIMFGALLVVFMVISGMLEAFL